MFTCHKLPEKGTIFITLCPKFLHFMIPQNLSSETVSCGARSFKASSTVSGVNTRHKKPGIGFPARYNTWVISKMLVRSVDVMGNKFCIDPCLPSQGTRQTLA